MSSVRKAVFWQDARPPAFLAQVRLLRAAQVDGSGLGFKGAHHQRNPRRRRKTPVTENKV